MSLWFLTGSFFFNLRFERVFVWNYGVDIVQEGFMVRTRGQRRELMRFVSPSDQSPSYKPESFKVETNQPEFSALC